MRLLRSRCLALVLLAPPVALAAAQTPADAVLCERAGDARYPDARPRVQQGAGGAAATAAFFRGCLAMADQQWGRAADEFERAARAADGNAVAHFWLGRAYGAQAQRANVLRQASLARKTKAHLDRAVQLDPDYLDAREGLMQYYLQAPGIVGGSKDKAREQAAEIRRRSAYRGALAAARIAAGQKDTAAVAREYRQLTAQFPDSAAGWLSLYGLQMQQRRYGEAARTVEGMERAQPASPVVPYLVGRLAAESGEQLERGEQALRRYLTTTPRPSEPTLASAHWRLGMILERQGRRDAARAEYQAALARDPSLAGARDALARLK